MKCRLLLKAEVINEHRVRITTTTPIPLLPRVLAALPIPAPQQWARLGVAGFAREPVGTGPFQVTGRKATALSLKAFKGSWRVPKEAGLEFTIVPTPTARVSGLVSGAFDVAFDLGPDDMKTLKDSGNVGVVSITNSVTGITFFLAQPSPFSDIRVRQAVNMAVNRQAIIDGLLGGMTRVSTQPVTPQTLGYDATLQAYAYDPVRAKALLAEGGFFQGLQIQTRDQCRVCAQRCGDLSADCARSASCWYSDGDRNAACARVSNPSRQRHTASRGVRGRVACLADSGWPARCAYALVPASTCVVLQPNRYATYSSSVG